MNIPHRKLIPAAIALALATGSANAVLERVGPTNTAPSLGGFPAWYQDTSGLALEFCDPKNAAEVAGGYCLLLPGDVPVVPEAFPTSFFDEHFWFAADAVITPASGGKALLVLAVEAAFAADVAPGGQIAFSRIRFVLNPVPVSGSYRVIHPYGEEIFQAHAGQGIFYTDDVGISCPPGQFDCATQSRLGPFLLPANTPGGAELPAVSGPVPGTLYIADPARSGPVTGSSLPDFTDSTGALRNHNIFRVEGPSGSGLGIDPATGAAVDFIETTDFSLMGRVFTGQVPSKVDVERASYVRNASGTKVDVFATAVDTTQGRVPTQARPAPVAPQLTFYDAPCAGTADPVTGEIRPPFSAPAGATEIQMFSIAPGLHWGASLPTAVPASVCVKDSAARDAAGSVVPAFHARRVTDEVTVTSANFNRGAGTLTVAATSSDEVAPPTLTLAYGTFRGDLVNGQIVVPNLIASPATVRVHSGAAGSDQAQVQSGSTNVAPAGLPVASNDSFTFAEDSPAQPLGILANDANVAGGTVTLGAPPRLGSAALNADGTVTYTPNPNASGADQFTYTVAVGAQVSNTGTVALNLTPANDPPVAADDGASAIAGVPTLFNVLANDSDPDGAGDLVAAANLTQPATQVGATIAVAGGLVSFSAGAGGTYTFTYQAQDAAGAVSVNAATVTVQVAAAETVNIARAEYVRSKGRLRASGTVSPAAGQTVTLEFVNSLGTPLGAAGTATVDAVGAWVVNAAVPLPTGATALRVTSSNGTTRAATVAIK